MRKPKSDHKTKAVKTMEKKRRIYYCKTTTLLYILSVNISTALCTVVLDNCCNFKDVYDKHDWPCEEGIIVSIFPDHNSVKNQRHT